MHAAPPDGSEWWSWDPDERNFESSRCSLADEHRSFVPLDRTAEVADARSESDRGTSPAAVLDGVFEGAAFRRDVLSVLLDVRRHQCTLIDNVDRLLVKWSTDGTLSDSSNWNQPKASDRTLSDSSNWKQPKASDQKRSTTQADREIPSSSGSPSSSLRGRFPSLDWTSEARKKDVQLEYEKTKDRYQKRSTMPSDIMERELSRSVSLVNLAGFRCAGRCSLCEAVVESSMFNIVVISLILLNTVCVGYDVNRRMQQSVEQYEHKTSGHVPSSSREDWLKVADTFLSIFFTMELVLRVVAHQGRFCSGQYWRWNLFDVLMVCASLFEFGLLVSFKLSHIRVIRVLRIARSFRVVRLLRFSGLRNLRLMLMAIIGSAIPLVWAGLILMAVMFFFAVVFLNGVADYISEATLADPSAQFLRVFFPDLAMTLLTLFMSITGGLDWWDLQKALLDVSVVYACIFVFFQLVTVLAALNIITGIFVNDAVEMARLDSEMKVQQEMDQNRRYLQTLHELFQEIDTKKHGAITLEDFKEQMGREDVRMLFAMLGLEVSDAVSFFSLLDVDGSVELEIDEFVMGCMRFRGNPTNVNLECSLLEAKQLLVKSLARQKRMEEKVFAVEGLVEGLCMVLGVDLVQRSGAHRRVRRDDRRPPPLLEGDESNSNGAELSTSFTLGQQPSDEPVVIPHVSPPVLCR